MKKTIASILLFFMLVTPSHALNIIERFIYKEVRLGTERVLVNKITDRVEKRLIGNEYQPISTQKGWGGIPSDQDMFQAQYEKIKNR